MAAERQLRGARAEQAAAALLVRAGLTQIAANARFRGGELDLVMRDGGSWIFVEVRHRADNRFGGAAESITPAKQKKLMHAAEVYLASKAIQAPCRFDAVLTVGNQPPVWLKNIFA